MPTRHVAGAVGNDPGRVHSLRHDTSRDDAGPWIKRHHDHLHIHEICLRQEGFYSNRTDFIRTAIRNHLATHAEAVRQAVVRKTLLLGLVEFTRADLEGVKKSGKRLRIQVLGLARIAPDVSVALALAVIESVSVLGAFQASPAVKAALANRI